MQRVRSPLVRHVAAVVVIAAACPLALFGGALIGCASQGFTTSCAMSGLVVAPMLLFAAGLVAALLSPSPTGLLVVLVGVALGMTSLFVLAIILGESLPLDPVQAFIAWVWFITPTTVGYGLGRIGVRLTAALRA
jgi:hypothetical protein